MSPSNSNAMLFPSGETSREIQVPSSVVNSIFRADFRERPFFPSFFSSFLSSFFSCAPPLSCRAKLAPKRLPAPAPNITARTASRAATPSCKRLVLILIPPNHQYLRNQKPPSQRAEQSISDHP